MASFCCHRLKGKVAIVTASTEGLGFAIAQRLAEEGASVVISSRQQSNVDRALKELRGQGLDVEGIVCHAAKKEDRTRLIQETVKRYGGIDILVSNVGINPVRGTILKATTEEMWDQIFEVNVKSVFFLIKEIVPFIEKRGGGSIVVMSSIAGYSPHHRLGAYSVSKTALLCLTKVLVPELSPKNIRINTLAPGVIKTNMTRGVWKNPSNLAAEEEKIPLGRIGLPHECSGAVAFMVSDDASYMTGESIIISGGLCPRL